MPFFLALCGHRTLSAAARALGVNHATVARRLSHLEQDLGLVLFTQLPDGYELTADGAIIQAHADAMQAAAGLIHAHSRASADDAPRVVRITATRTLADVWLADQLDRLRASRPDIVLEILTTSRNLSLARHEADIALRLARPPEGDLLIRKVATLGYGFYAAPAYLAATSPDQRAFILYEQGSTVPEAIWLEALAAGRPVALRNTSLLGQKRAAGSGLGIALLPRYLGEIDPKLAALRLPDQPPDREVWMVATRQAARLAPVRAVMDDLASAFARDRALFMGPRGG